ncbi:MAG TPA: AMP-binding protein [Steroidobacteraceae bacterium]|nr:AMP-binding protein [Steroidobacteraceae bacterium]
MRAADRVEGAALSPAEVLALYRPHDGTITSFLTARCEALAAKPVVQFEQRVWSYAELAEGSLVLSHVLAARGIGHGARLVLISLNSDLSVLLFLAAARLGALFIPLNPAATADELTYLLGHARAALIVCQQEDFDRVGAVARTLPDGAPLLSLNELGVTGSDARAVIAQLRSLGAAPIASSPRVSSDDAAVVIYTSGTTGFPKGVVHTQRSYILAAEGFVARMHLQPGERLLTVMPFFHINALFYSLGGALAAGGTLVTTVRFSASQFWDLAARSGATQFNFLAAIGNILMNRPRSEFNPTHRIRKLYGGPISERMYEVFPREFNVPALIEGYGMSEIPGACCNPFLGPHKPGSIGLPAVHPNFPGSFAQLRVVDEEDHELPPGAVGELVVRTPMMFREYLDDPVQTAAAFRNGWFLTGDLARRDADGYFYFVARKKDIIRRRGENVSGAELDRIISDHPEVQEAAAVGVPAPLGEEDILVAIVRKPQSQVQPEEILQWCRARLAALKVPRYITFVESLPHTPSHRVAKHRLKGEATLLARAFDGEGES